MYGSFLWKRVVFHFNLSKEIITNNGNKFIGNKVKEFVMKQSERLFHSSLYYPEANRQIELSNKLVLKLLKKAQVLEGKSVE